jgi:hypothetical protein
MTMSMQQFRWDSVDGYLSCLNDSNLVVGIGDDGKVVEVLLKRRNPTDILQRWLLIPSNVGHHRSTSQEEVPFDTTQPL